MPFRGISQPGLGKNTIVPRTSLDKWGAILPDKPRIHQFTPPVKKGRQENALAESPSQELEEDADDLTPENIADLSIDDILAAAGISLDDEKTTKSATKSPIKENSVGCLAPSQLFTSVDGGGTRQTREKDSLMADSLLPKINITSQQNDCNDNLEDQDCNTKEAELGEDEMIRDDELDEETVESDNPGKDLLVVDKDRPRYPPRLPPLCLPTEGKGLSNHGESDVLLKGSRQLQPFKNSDPNRPGQKQKPKKTQQRKECRDGCMMKGQLMPDSDSVFIQKESTLNGRDCCQFSFNNNGWTETTNGESKDNDFLKDTNQNAARSKETPQHSQSSPRSMLQTMINWVSGAVSTSNTATKATRSFTIPPVGLPADDVIKQTTTTLGVPPGLGVVSTPQDSQHELKTSLIALPVLGTHLANRAMDSNLGTSGFEVTALTGFETNLRSSDESRTPHSLGFQRQKIPSGTTIAESVEATDIDIEQSHTFQTDNDTSMAQDDYDSEDWFREVLWPADWRETNRDASHLPAELREELRIDLSGFPQDDDSKPKPQSQNLEEDTHVQEVSTVYDETAKSNGNNNHQIDNAKIFKGTQAQTTRTPTSTNSSRNVTWNTTSTSLEDTAERNSSKKKLSSDACSNNRDLGSYKSTIHRGELSLSSDSLWSQSVTTWGLDAEELMLLLSYEQSDNTSGFASDEVFDEDSFFDTIMGIVADSQLYSESDPSLLTTPEIVSPFCFTLPNGEHDVLDLHKVHDNCKTDLNFEEKICPQSLTDSRDSLDSYLTERTRTELELKCISKTVVAKKPGLLVNHSKDTNHQGDHEVSEQGEVDNVTHIIPVKSTEDNQLHQENENTISTLNVVASDATHSLEVQSKKWASRSSSLTPDVKKWMRLNDMQMEEAIQAERLTGGRSVPAPQVTASESTYDRIVNWVEKSDFSITPSIGQDGEG
ncbi:uncharacterized protein LOC119745508 [Patiria miniata]|uniref:Uncharacterized protein n=1 Tax=Patiria miniata TaxID=46514 RepID=A0A914BNV5_PATMI|nr:uncharacterized protein LOC119745508 [Patiria miniata]